MNTWKLFRVIDECVETINQQLRYNQVKALSSMEQHSLQEQLLTLLQNRGSNGDR